ncbi:stage II sporulation protein R [Ruminococcus flavefaciens]|uniref:Stage II sporulation protein R n=1 Tax=Ruminococcus flavefaciens TaxID=1265 RepID=A0A1H6HW48_RUMFL|nr:stage II sporulation protein R [Ruminococcus flavefaciens]SEH40169.1 stage II sporulation protein R [Ruminococcus flavefaciens]
MKKPSWKIMAAGLILTILISNMSSFISDGLKLEELRGSVLRLHILANSDSEKDQQLKLMVRDELLERGIFNGAADLDEAERIAKARMSEIVRTAESVLRRNGCMDRVSAELADADFDERVYGDITMPAGRYRALRIMIGDARGHNWWCVMYPPLCLPAACEETEDADSEDETVTDDKSAEEENFDEKELDILKKPKKYKLKFALWDKIKSIFS